MLIKFQKILDEAIIPHYAHQGDAGMDIFSAEDAVIKSGEIKSVKTGVKMEMPERFVGLVWDKSGLAFKNGIKTMAGVIDSNYRGELMIVLTNLGKEPYHVEKGSKIAQLIITPVASPEIEEGIVADDTERGTAGFGSSGTV